MEFMLLVLQETVPLHYLSLNAGIYDNALTLLGTFRDVPLLAYMKICT